MSFFLKKVFYNLIATERRQNIEMFVIYLQFFFLLEITVLALLPNISGSLSMNDKNNIYKA